MVAPIVSSASNPALNAKIDNLIKSVEKLILNIDTFLTASAPREVIVEQETTAIRTIDACIFTLSKVKGMDHSTEKVQFLTKIKGFLSNMCNSTTNFEVDMEKIIQLEKVLNELMEQEGVH